MTLIELVSVIFTMNLLTFGGGATMVPLLQTELVDKRKAITLDQLLYAFAIARATPGQANMYVAAVGYMMFGLVGAGATILSIILPSFVVLPLLKGYRRINGSSRVQGFTKGLTISSIGLILATTLNIGRSSLTGPLSWLVFGTSLVMIRVLKLNALIAIMLASLLGVLLKLYTG